MLSVTVRQDESLRTGIRSAACSYFDMESWYKLEIEKRKYENQAYFLGLIVMFERFSVDI